MSVVSLIYDNTTPQFTYYNLTSRAPFDLRTYSYSPVWKSDTRTGHAFRATYCGLKFGFQGMLEAFQPPTTSQPWRLGTRVSLFGAVRGGPSFDSVTATWAVDGGLQQSRKVASKVKIGIWEFFRARAEGFQRNHTLDLNLTLEYSDFVFDHAIVEADGSTSYGSDAKII